MQWRPNKKKKPRGRKYFDPHLAIQKPATENDKNIFHDFAYGMKVEELVEKYGIHPNELKIIICRVGILYETAYRRSIK